MEKVSCFFCKIKLCISRTMEIEKHWDFEYLCSWTNILTIFKVLNSTPAASFSLSFVGNFPNAAEKISKYDCATIIQ